MKRETTTSEIDLLPAPKEELERRLKIFALLNDAEREMLRRLWLDLDHARLFSPKRGRGFHSFD